MSETIDCGCCGGTGRVELTGVYADTLALLRQQSKRAYGAELARLSGCTTTAMCNRLVALEKLGLVVGTRYGRRRMWQATHAQK